MKAAQIIAGLWFLFIPGVNIIDPIPDFIGYALILYGIYGISNIDYSFSDAARYFRFLAIAGLLKLPALYVYFISGEEERTWTMLVMSMIFSAFELIFGLFAWKNFFEGLDARIVNSGQTGALDRTVTKARRATYVFVIAKPVLCVLPDLSILSSGDYGIVTDSGIFSLSQYRGLFTVIAMFISLIIGIVWLVITARALGAVKKNSAVIESIRLSVEEYEKNTRRVKVKSLLVALSFLATGILFSLELKIEGYCLIPPFISAVLMCMYFAVTSRLFGKTAKRGLFLSAAYGVFSTAGWILGMIFTDKYYTGDDGAGFSSVIKYMIGRNYAVMDELIVIAVLCAVAAVFFAASLFVLAGTLSMAVDDYCGIQQVGFDGTDVPESVLRHEKAEDANIKKSLKGRKKFFLFIAAVTSLCSAVFTMLQIYFGEFFMIDLIVRIIFVTYAFLWVLKIRDAVKLKEGLDNK